jgi:hypothetical protein
VSCGQVLSVVLHLGSDVEEGKGGVVYFLSHSYEEDNYFLPALGARSVTVGRDIET